MCHIGSERNDFGWKKHKIWAVMAETNRGLFLSYLKGLGIAGIGEVAKRYQEQHFTFCHGS